MIGPEGSPRPASRRAAALSARPCGRGRGRRLGSTLVELLVSIVILIAGIRMAVYASIRTSRLQQTTAGYIEANNTARDVLEQFRNGNLVQRFQQYAAQPNFTVGDQSVQVQFPQAILAAALGGAVPAGARFRDVNGDGQVDLVAASTAPSSLLPVQVTVTRGAFRLQVSSLVTQ